LNHEPIHFVDLGKHVVIFLHLTYKDLAANEEQIGQALGLENVTN